MEITFTNDQDDPLPGEPLISIASVAMEAEALPESTQLSITLIDEERMAELNGTYMDKLGPTDVLSFPIEDFSTGVTDPDPSGPPLLLGDIVICPSVVRANARSAGVAFEDEMALMIVHGVLHLLGRDHVIESEAEEMEEREREILAMVGMERP
jgi:probable rRNA maturation factor